MSDVTVLSRTQRIVVNPTSNAVSIVNAGPQGPAGAGVTTLEPRVDDLETNDAIQDTDIDDLQALWALNGVVHITGPVVEHPGPVFTNHDAKHWYGRRFEGNATYNANGGQLQAPPVWEFPDTGTTWIKWLWQPGDGWEFYTVRFGFIVSGFVGSTQSRWRYSEERFQVDAVDPAGSVINVPAEVASRTIPSPGAIGLGNRYTHLAEHVPWTSPFELVLSTIERVPGHADDTQVGSLGVYTVTATRTDGP